MTAPVQRTNIPRILGDDLPAEYLAVQAERDRVAERLTALDDYAAYLRRVARAADVALDSPVASASPEPRQLEVVG